MAGRQRQWVVTALAVGVCSWVGGQGRAQQRAATADEARALVDAWFAAWQQLRDGGSISYTCHTTFWIADSVEEAFEGKWQENPYEGVIVSRVRGHHGVWLVERKQSGSKKTWSSGRSTRLPGGGMMTTGLGTRGQEWMTFVAGGVALGKITEFRPLSAAGSSYWRVTRADWPRWGMSEVYEDPLTLKRVDESPMTKLRMLLRLLESVRYKAMPGKPIDGHPTQVVEIDAKGTVRSQRWEQHWRLVFDACCPGPPLEIQDDGDWETARGTTWTRVQGVKRLPNGRLLPTRVVHIYRTERQEHDSPLAGKIHIVVLDFEDLLTDPATLQAPALSLEKGAVILCDHEPPHIHTLTEEFHVDGDTIEQLPEKVCGAEADTPPNWLRGRRTVAQAATDRTGSVRRSDTRQPFQRTPGVATPAPAPWRNRSLRWLGLGIAAIALVWLLGGWYMRRFWKGGRWMRRP